MPILTHEERIGTLLAEKYRLESILGRGGMGAVFGGRHEWTGRRVAVKLLNYEYAQHAEMAERFLREARTAGSLTHPNVVDVLDMGRDADGTVYLVLERLDGQSLASVLGSITKLAPPRAYELLVPVMRALAYAHKKGIVHRDLKPDNIFVSEDPEHGTVPKLLDFGIAKVLDGGQSTGGTRTGTVMGTAEYMSPEQARGTSDIGPASDVWSMGVVWYECLTGAVPFEGTNATGIILAIVDGRHESLAARAPHLPRSLVDAVERALQVDRASRYPDMVSFLDALEAARVESGAGALPPANATGSFPRLEVSGTSPTEIKPSQPITVLPAARPAVDPGAPTLAPPSSSNGETNRTSSSTAMQWTEASPAPRRSRATALVVGGLAALAIGGGALAAVLSGSHRPPTAAAAAPTLARPAPTPATAAPANPAPAVQTETPSGRTETAALAPSAPAPAALPPAPAVNPPADTLVPSAHAPSSDAYAVETHSAPSHVAHATHGGHHTPPPSAPAPVATAPAAPAPVPVRPPPAPPAAPPHPAPSHATSPSRDPNAPLTNYELGP